MQDPAPARPIEASPETPPKASAHPAAAAPMLLRVVFGLAGVGLVIGFFLPWVRFGDAISISGMGMAITGGQTIDELSGPFSAVIFAVPLAGVALVVGAARGARSIAWMGLVSGCLIFVVGLVTLIRVFLDSTGPGMWVVVFSALMSTIFGLFVLRRRHA